VRLIYKTMAFAFLLLGFASVCGTRATAARPAATQEQELGPEQSAAKARQLLRQVIAALGGQAYLNVRDTQCDGRAAQFGTAGTLMGFTLFRDLWLLPDKNRVEYLSKGEHTILGFLMGSDELLITHGGATITVYNGQEGWSVDKSGVSNQPDDLIQNFNEQLKTSMNNMLRKRMNEPGVDVQYAGPDLIDMKESDWIEFTDSDHREMRLGIDKYTHLPLRWVVASRNPETRERLEAITSYTQYMAFDGVKTPLSVELSRNDRKLSQTFFSACKFNADLAPDLFTRASLEQSAAAIAKKGYKDSKSTK
jgi:outer membrane lipoprotein-sorting protein